MLWSMLAGLGFDLDLELLDPLMLTLFLGEKDPAVHIFDQ